MLNIYPRLSHLYPYVMLALSLTAFLGSSCNVVIARLEPATEFGFNLSGELDVQEPYAIGATACRTELFPDAIFPTENATMPANYLTALQNTYPGWTFNAAANSLGEDAIEIKTYDAIGTSTRVGVWIHARYVPQAGDPTDNIHWVQVLTTNHGLKGPAAGHGPSATYVDAATGTTTPYYDEGYAADSRDIIDRPSRGDAASNHTWQATTFLVTGPDVGDGAGTVTLLGPGFTWGWKNTCADVDGLNVEYFYYVKEQLDYRMEELPSPGGILALKSDAKVPMFLERNRQSVAVTLVNQDINFRISREIDPGGTSELTAAEGSLSFASYTFEGKQMPATTAKIESGNGIILWDTGEASLEIQLSLPLPNGQEEQMVFNGTAQYDTETATFTLNNDFRGYRTAFVRSNVPKDTKTNKDRKGKRE